MDDKELTEMKNLEKTGLRPVIARKYACEMAKAINDLLCEPVAVLPAKEGDVIYPLQLGAGPAFARLIKQNVSRKILNEAINRYTRCTFYRLACIQKGAMRHDLAGNPVEPINEVHRAFAREMLEKQKNVRRDSNASTP
ncbi:ProQ/FINO family protein [Brucella sp. 22210]|uniref:ProQ/FINO family protein n=1 Tax=Brucella sp. 22210 TaxID=3453892 RepID=UPI003F8450E3